MKNLVIAELELLLKALRYYAKNHPNYRCDCRDLYITLNTELKEKKHCPST